MAYQGLRKQLGLDRKPQTPAAVPAPPQPVTQANGETPKATKPKATEADAKQVVTRSCGCKIGVRHLEQSACPACVRKNKQRRPLRRRAAPDRLPDNAAFAVVYDATAQTWAGTLTIGDQIFEAKASAIFHLLSVLDKKYRDSVG
jgi:hypothetical protein